MRQSAFQRIAKQTLGQLDGAPRELKNLHRFDAGEIVEKPAAARIHEHGMTLHFHQLETRRRFRVAQSSLGMTCDKALNVCC